MDGFAGVRVYLFTTEKDINMEIIPSFALGVCYRVNFAHDLNQFSSCVHISGNLLLKFASGHNKPAGITLYVH